MTRKGLFVSASPVVVLVACAGSGAADMGVDGSSEDATDVGADAELLPSALYEACENDSQCPGADGSPGGGICRPPADGFNSGSCTLPYTPPDDTPCNDSIVNHCADLDGDGTFFCERRCLNGIDCLHDHYTCAGAVPPSGEGVCVGVCATDADCGPGGTCGAGGRCSSRQGSGGASNGSACASASACRSEGCILASGVMDGIQWPNIKGVGFVGGYCTQTCILPTGYNSTTFYAGSDLPQGGCPTNEVCFPTIFPIDVFVDGAGSGALTGRLARGDAGFCAPTCGTDADCRAGYECFGLDQFMFTRGVCIPGCYRTPCPTGTTCSPYPYAECRPEA